MKRGVCAFFEVELVESFFVLESAIGFDDYLPYAIPRRSEERVIMN